MDVDRAQYVAERINERLLQVIREQIEPRFPGCAVGIVVIKDNDPEVSLMVRNKGEVQEFADALAYLNGAQKTVIYAGGDGTTSDPATGHEAAGG